MPEAPLVFAGVATHDTITLVERFPEPDERMVVDDLVTAGGGPAATSAVAAARLGHRVAFVGVVGDDPLADRIRETLEAEGVDTTGLVTVPDHPSASSVVIVDARRATRAILNRPPPPAPAVEQLPPAARRLLADAGWLHVDQAGWALCGDWWRRAGTDRPRLSIDAGNPVPGLDLGGIDLYVPTISALRRRWELPLASPVDLLTRALEEGARAVVATDGAEGSWVASPEEPIVSVPPATGEIRSTLGAGDVFHGALLAAVARDLPLADAAAYANQVAVQSCRGLDGRSAIPTHDAALAALDPDREFP